MGGWDAFRSFYFMVAGVVVDGLGLVVVLGGFIRVDMAGFGATDRGGGAVLGFPPGVGLGGASCSSFPSFS